VFTKQEFAEFILESRDVKPRTSDGHLRYYVKQKRLVRIHRGLYAAVPLGYSVDQFEINPYQLISRLSVDSVIAYHSALQFFGKSYSIYHTHTFLTRSRPRKFFYQGVTYRPVHVPKLRIKNREEIDGIVLREKNGMRVHVTSLERTMVDVMDRQDLSGGWEEIWRSLESVEFFDLDQVIKYANRINNSTTTAKVGFFLEMNAETLMVDESYLIKLESKRPKKPHYWSRDSKGPTRLVNRWNLIIPEQIIDRSWEEVY